MLFHLDRISNRLPVLHHGIPHLALVVALNAGCEVEHRYAIITARFSVVLAPVCIRKTSSIATLHVWCNTSPGAPLGGAKVGVVHQTYAVVLCVWALDLQFVRGTHNTGVSSLIHGDHTRGLLQYRIVVEPCENLMSCYREYMCCISNTLVSAENQL